VWCGVVWCGVVWCGVVWCGVVWCGVVCLPSGNKLLHEQNVLPSVITNGGYLWKLDLFTELTKNINDFNTTL
jgi:hypothetical protein